MKVDKWIILWALFLLVDTGFYAAAGRETLQLTDAFKLPGGGIIAYGISRRGCK